MIYRNLSSRGRALGSYYHTIDLNMFGLYVYIYVINDNKYYRRIGKLPTFDFFNKKNDILRTTSWQRIEVILRLLSRLLCHYCSKSCFFCLKQETVISTVGWNYSCAGYSEYDLMIYSY